MEQTDKFTAEEKTILKNIDSKYHWITRDSNDEKGNLWIFMDKPHKYNGYWDNYTDGGILFLPFKNIFKNIKWEDDEPTYIKYNNILDDEEKRFIKKYIIENPAYRNKGVVIYFTALLFYILYYFTPHSSYEKALHGVSMFYLNKFTFPLIKHLIALI